jgi:hypothetical protein
MTNSYVGSMLVLGTFVVLAAVMMLAIRNRFILDVGRTT